MFKRFILCAFLGLSLSACSSTSDRYAFWRDGNEPQSAKPNLGNVPAAPDTSDAKSEMDALRARLQMDRDNAYRAAQGLPPLQETTTVSPSSGSEMMEPQIMSEELPQAGQPTQAWPQFNPNNPMPMSGGNVQYNYGSDNALNNGYETYVYGYSPVQINQQQVLNGAPATGSTMVAANDSVSIDFSALDNNAPAAALSPSVAMIGNGQPLVYFKHGSARLGALDKQRIAELATQLKQRPSSLVIIGHASKPTGHHDPVTAEDINLRMSARRASVVMRELARHGVSANQVHMTAQGDAQPAAPQPGMSSEAADRRVEILFD